MKEQYFWLFLSVPHEGCMNHSICIFILSEECKPSSKLKHTSLLTFHTYTCQDRTCFQCSSAKPHISEQPPEFCRGTIHTCPWGAYEICVLPEKAAATSHLSEVLDILVRSGQGDGFGNFTWLPHCSVLFVLKHSCCLSKWCTLHVFKCMDRKQWWLI